jgi:hypothetical protein
VFGRAQPSNQVSVRKGALGVKQEE